MTAGNDISRIRRTPVSLRIIASIAAAGAITGLPAVFYLAAGALIVAVSFMFGRILTMRLAIETDPTRELVWDALLVLVIVLALVGVGVMAVAIP